ncbi:glycosyltransferase family 4 protein [Yeosuana sp. MJ-SS3]|uniref:Glycosyltransferase family 4 protein n=1 Tax=Gilvirhabdus luticola TaxID=3079858 RepID=A0ABU3U4Z0_9FLAO|nr:glycosyltransferase family 4 protein [Yeosuana sp. MJ-SS3]MDU8885481.1 glycosyltransferase family 4 protein [Yeosuana sp. MJ-SS3]
MPPLKIAVVVGQFPTISETFIVNQIRFLKSQGHQVHIYCFKKIKIGIHPSDDIHFKDVKLLEWQHFMPKNKLKRFFKIFSILIKSINFSIRLDLIKRFNLFKYKKDAFNGYVFFRRYFELYFEINNYDVVHVHFANHAVRLLRQLEIFQKRIIVSFHGFDAHNYDHQFYNGLLKLKTICYTTNTAYTKDKIIDLGFPDHLITILPVGLDTNFFKPTQNLKKSERFNILFVGRLVVLKSPLLAIKIIEQLVNQNITNLLLTIVGDGEEFQRCEDYIVSHELEPYITLKGSQNQLEIVELMNSSDMFLLPGIKDDNNKAEAQGLVIQEAQAMQLPVIISDVGGMKDGVLDGKTGFVLKAHDIDAFVKCILYLIEHPKERIAMGSAGRKFAVKNYDISVLGQQLLDLYR